MIKYELFHHGVKGQKWGIRRYQNADGSLTKLGKKRYGKMEPEEAKKAIISDSRKEVLASRSAEALYENAFLFNDKELQTAYNRLNLERSIMNLAPSDTEKGKNFVEKAIGWGDTASKALVTGTNLYNNFAKIYNSKTESGRERPLTLIKENNQNKKNKKDKDDD